MTAALHLDAMGELHLTANDLVGERIAVLGIPGSGKSYTARVLVEELLPYIAMTIVDIDGEYHTLRDRFPAIEIYGGSHGQEFADAAVVAKHSFDDQQTVILDFSESKQEFMYDWLVGYFEQIWASTSARENRKPYGVLIEEAHKFVPQGKTTAIKSAISDLAARGRKRGLTTIYVSQRSAKVDKDVLTTAGLYFLHYVQHPNDMATYINLVPKPPKRVQEVVAGLQVGQSIVRYGKLVQVVTTRQAHTRPAGSTPQLQLVAKQESEVEEIPPVDLKPQIAPPPVRYGIDVLPASPWMLHIVQKAQMLPIKLRMAQVLMDRHNLRNRERRLHDLLAERNRRAAQQSLTIYAEMIWRLQALIGQEE